MDDHSSLQVVRKYFGNPNHRGYREPPETSFMSNIHWKCGPGIRIYGTGEQVSPHSFIQQRKMGNAQQGLQPRRREWSNRSSVDVWTQSVLL